MLDEITLFRKEADRNIVGGNDVGTVSVRIESVKLENNSTI